MKRFLGIIIVLLLGLCGWIRFTSTRPTETHRKIIAGLKTELKEAQAEFDTAREELAVAKGEIESLKRRYAALESNEVARHFPPASDSPAVVGEGGPEEAPDPKAPFPSSKHEDLISRLSALKATYDSHRLSIENRKDLLEVDLAALHSKRNAVAKTELHFSEQSAVVDLDGNVTGNRGVRTSMADRARATAKLAEQVAEVDREIAGKQLEINKLVGEMETLRQNYSKAIARAQEEFSADKGAAAN
jgi:hypothetical protein